MTTLASRLRALIRGSDRLAAMEAEADVLAVERDRTRSLDNQLADQFRRHDDAAVTLGFAADGGWPVQIAPERLAGHMGFWGPSGSGKSYLLALLLRHLLRSGVRSFVVADPKSETVELAKRAIVEFSRTLSPAEADDLLDRVVVLDLFSSSTLPRLQVLAPEEGVDAELQAYEIAGIVTTEIDNSAVGVRQEAVLHRVLESLIRAGLPLTVLPTALETPELLDALAEKYAPAAFFRAVAARLRKESKDRVLGLVSRADRLLRLRSVRLALGGSPNRIDFAKLLDGRMTLINLSPPQGSTDVGKFMAGLVWVQLNHAIRRRPNGSAPTWLMVDEWPTFLAAGGAHLADTFEDLLRLARSKGVALAVLSQDMTSVAKVSHSIAEVVKNNLHMHMVFRAQDANAWDFALPVTGTKPKPPGPPWEEPRLGYMERSAELTMLRQGLERLPDRHCYLVDRRTGLPGVLMRTADLALDASLSDVRQLEERAAKCDAVATVAELERGEGDVHRRI